jgi:hypothetical protein
MPAKTDFDPSRATIGELVQEVLRLRADIAIMAANVVQQAIERNWCGEYEQWARITNKQMSRPHCIDRTDLESEATETNPEVPGAIVNCTCVDCERVRQAAREAVPVHDPGPIYRDPATGDPYDPSLDESGRFSVTPPNPTWVYREGCHCETCDLHRSNLPGLR